MIPQTTNHEALAVSRLLAQFEDADDLKALAKSYAEQVQDLEDAAFEVMLERVLGTAVGAQLDMLGAIVGRARSTSDDALYEIEIRTQIAINLSHGTAEDLLAIAALIFQSGETYEIRIEPPSQVRLVIHEVPPVEAAFVIAILKRAKPAGHRLLIDYPTATEADQFTMADSIGGTTTGKGLGSTTTAATGGVGSGVAA